MSQFSTPRVFVSAPSSDLKSARKVINEELARIECLPVEESIFGSEYGPVSEMLSRKIASCHAVIHVVGRDYGGEPTSSNLQLPNTRRSWSQIEYDIAKKLNKKLYIFVCDQSFPFDSSSPESEDKAKLVAAHRHAILGDRHLWHSVKDMDDLKQKVEQLKLPLDEVRADLTTFGTDVKVTGRRIQAGLLAVVALVLLSIGIAILASRGQADIRTGIDSLQLQLENVARGISLLPKEASSITDSNLSNELRKSGLSELKNKMEQLVEQLTDQTSQGDRTKEDELRLRRASAIIQYSTALEHLEKGKTEDALQEYGQAIDSYSTLVNKDSRQDLEDILARSLQNRGVLLFQSTETQQQGAEDLKVAESIFNKLVDKPQPTPVTHSGDGGSKENVATASQSFNNLSSPLPGITSEPGNFSAIVVNQMVNEPKLTEVYAVKAGTDLSYFHPEQSTRTLGAAMLVDPGMYDIVAKYAEGTVVLAKNVEVKESERKVVNPDALLGRLVLEPLTLPKFPKLASAFLLKAGTDTNATFYKLHSWDKFGLPLIVEPGTFDVLCTPVDGQFFFLQKNIEIRAGQIQSIDINQHAAAIVCRDPKIDDFELDKIHVVSAGTDPRSRYPILQESKGFDLPLMVQAGEKYDILLCPKDGVPVKFNKREITAEPGRVTYFEK